MLQDPVAVEVGAGVTNVDEAELFAREHGGGDGGAHAVQGVVGSDQVSELVIGAGDRCGQYHDHLVAGAALVDPLDEADGDRAGQVAGGSSAHSVGDHQQVG
ncbi:Uncharacterised protein [Mycobacteroides abscessus subsp. abscessus]|nr:Uncharacterised protein [Mycobacteroides abscessus subsp. abscessus]